MKPLREMTKKQLDAEIARLSEALDDLDDEGPDVDNEYSELYAHYRDALMWRSRLMD